MAGNKHAGGRSSRSTVSRVTRDSPEDEAPPNSQASEDLSLQSIMAQMLNSSRRRRDTRRIALQNEYSKRIDKVREDINKRFDAYHSKMNKRNKQRRSQLGKLRELLQRKVDIEAQMAASIHKLEVAYIERAQELRAVLTSRAEEFSFERPNGERLEASTVYDYVPREGCGSY